MRRVFSTGVSGRHGALDMELGWGNRNKCFVCFHLATYSIIEQDISKDLPSAMSLTMTFKKGITHIHFPWLYGTV